MSAYGIRSPLPRVRKEKEYQKREEESRSSYAILESFPQSSAGEGQRKRERRKTRRHASLPPEVHKKEEEENREREGKKTRGRRNERGTNRWSRSGRGCERVLALGEGQKDKEEEKQARENKKRRRREGERYHTISYESAEETRGLVHDPWVLALRLVEAVDVLLSGSRQYQRCSSQLDELVYIWYVAIKEKERERKRKGEERRGEERRGEERRGILLLMVCLSMRRHLRMPMASNWMGWLRVDRCFTAIFSAPLSTICTLCFTGRGVRKGEREGGYSSSFLLVYISSSSFLSSFLFLFLACSFPSRSLWGEGEGRVRGSRYLE